MFTSKIIFLSPPPSLKKKENMIFIYRLQNNILIFSKFIEYCYYN